MKVSELIERLQNYPQDAEILKYDGLNDRWDDIALDEWGISDDYYTAEDFSDGIMRDYFIEII